MKRILSTITSLMLVMAAASQSLNVNVGFVAYQFPAETTGGMLFSNGQTLTVCGQSFYLSQLNNMNVRSLDDGGIRLNFSLNDIVRIELESVDGYDISGTGLNYISFSAPQGQTLSPSTDYRIITGACDLTGGYRVTFFTQTQKADFYSVHQQVAEGQFISPDDLDESELEFVDIDAPFVEDERPGLNSQTKAALVAYQRNPTAENKAALMLQMGTKYDKVVARKKAKLRQLEREAKHQSLIDEMQAIVDEMVENRDIRLEQQFLRLIDPRTDDDDTDQWLVLHGAPTDNAYIAYAPVTNAEYAAYDTNYTYSDGQDNYPVVNITLAEAQAYCQWLSNSDATHLYRLPSEEEWILAAGHMPKDVSMNSDHVQSGLTPVDTYSQTTGACGGIDFWGNCWEWTTTQAASGQYIVKGGSWDSPRDSCRTEYSDDTRDATTRYPNLGFRIIRTSLP